MQKILNENHQKKKVKNFIVNWLLKSVALGGLNLKALKSICTETEIFCFRTVKLNEIKLKLGFIGYWNLEIVGPTTSGIDGHLQLLVGICWKEHFTPTWLIITVIRRLITLSITPHHTTQTTRTKVSVISRIKGCSWSLYRELYST